jgi:hypothetical protein
MQCHDIDNLFVQHIFRKNSFLPRFKYKILAEETKSRLNSGNACYRSFQNLFSSRFFSKNLGD